jgi:nicotinate phosphoribosyltransferase
MTSAGKYQINSHDATPRDEDGRILPEVFDLPVEKMRAGYYTDAYFNFTHDTLIKANKHPDVLMQVFQRKNSILAGVDEAIAILKLCSHNWEGLTVKALREGAEVSPWETVLTIEGDYTDFAHLETVYLGVMARRTLVATNVRRVVDAAGGKPILFFPARHDHHLVQTGDGYAALVGGIAGVSTDANASWWGGRGIGTVPHALIASYGGDTAKASLAFADWAPPEMNIAVLVDFHNNSCQTALEVARALGDRLWAVRLDTSGQLVDECLLNETGDFDPRGVNERLVRRVRAALDSEGFQRVQILVSGGFTAERIRLFEEEGVPTDSYGVGSSLLRGSNDFTADVVRCDGEDVAKVGRWLRPNPRLKVVK